jgi:hypothetical protein
MRFTLPKLFLVVTLAALACAGLTLRTRFWAEFIFSLGALLFALTALLAVGRSGRARVSSLAFALVGGGYLLLVSCNAFSPIRDLLLTNRALVLAGRALHVSAIDYAGVLAGSGHGWSGGAFQVEDSSGGSSSNQGLAAFEGGSANAPPFDPEEIGWKNGFFFGAPIADPQIPASAFLIIGHCVWSWLLALFAGWFCGAMWGKNQRAREKSVLGVASGNVI